MATTLPFCGRPPVQDTRRLVPCKFFPSGMCRNSDACPFSHERTAASQRQAWGASPAADTVLGRADLSGASVQRVAPPPPVLCRFFARGKCRNGDACVYAHDTGASASASPFASPFASASPSANQASSVTTTNTTPTWMGHGQTSEDDKLDDFSRTVFGALVRFGAGAAVESAALSSDFSAVRFSSLPASIGPAAIRDFLGGKGFDISMADIRLQPGLAATVRSTDARFSKTVCAASWVWGSGEPVQATSIAPPMPAGHNARRVDYKKLHVSWHKGTRIVWLGYMLTGVMKRVAELFGSGAYKILDQKVSVRQQGGGSIALGGVPQAATRADVVAAIRAEHHKPATVKLGEPSHTTEPDEASAIVQSLFTAVGPLEYWEITLESTARRVKATTRFLDASDARRAAEKLNATPLPFYPAGRLTVQIVYSAKFKVGTSVYGAVKGNILSRAEEWREQRNVSFYAYPSSDPLGRFRVLKVEAEEPSHVVAVGAELDKFLAGEVVTGDDGVALWDPSLRGNGKLHRAVMAIAQEMRVIVLRDKAREELHVFASTEKCKQVQARLVSLFKAESSGTTTRSVELSPEDFFWACNGGFKAVVAALGEEHGKVTFDIISVPRRIIVSGALEDYDLVQRMVERREKLVDTGEESAEKAVGDSDGDGDGDGDCAVCWTPAESPVSTPCGHVYCLDCFESSCISAMASAAGVVIHCHGASSACNTPLPLAFVKDHLPSAVFEDLLERSFNAYVQRNTDALRFCPAPGCGFVYRVTEAAGLRVCAGCFARTCAGCGGEAHEGHACVEWRAIKAGEDDGTKRLKSQLGVKDCPKCGVGIEKDGGCNHVTCKSCGCHMCWVCLMAFDEGGKVYDHMTKEHGGHVDLPR